MLVRRSWQHWIVVGFLGVAAVGGCGQSHPGGSGGGPPQAAGAGGSPAGRGGVGGAGGQSGAPAGTGGSSCGRPDSPSCGTGGEGIGSCQEYASANSGGLVGRGCVKCLCSMKPTEAQACTHDCFALAVCVAEHCDQTDTNCIVSQCADVVGGAANLATVGALARANAFLGCWAECFPTPPGSTDSGDDAGH